MNNLKKYLVVVPTAGVLVAGLALAGPAHAATNYGPGQVVTVPVVSTGAISSAGTKVDTATSSLTSSGNPVSSGKVTQVLSTALSTVTGGGNVVITGGTGKSVQTVPSVAVNNLGDTTTAFTQNLLTNLSNGNGSLSVGVGSSTGSTVSNGTVQLLNGSQPIFTYDGSAIIVQNSDSGVTLPANSGYVLTGGIGTVTIVHNIVRVVAFKTTTSTLKTFKLTFNKKGKASYKFPKLTQKGTYHLTSVFNVQVSTKVKNKTYKMNIPIKKVTTFKVK